MIKYLLLSCFLLAACTEKVSFRTDAPKVISFEDVPADIRVPSSAWDLLEGKSAEEHHEEAKLESGGGEHGGGKAEGGEHGKGAPGGGSDIIFSEVNVFFTQKNDGVLKETSYKIQLPRGGGEIDLADYMGNQAGSFYVGFEFPEFEDVVDKKVLFVSHARKRKVDGDVLGAGCNQFFDISKKFNKAMQGEGIKSNTTRERHATLLGGSFLVSAKKNASTYVTQVTFKDSKHPYLFCEGI
jgi:hypothetical protein